MEYIKHCTMAIQFLFLLILLEYVCLIRMRYVHLLCITHYFIANYSINNILYVSTYYSSPHCILLREIKVQPSEDASVESFSIAN